MLREQQDALAKYTAARTPTDGPGPVQHGGRHGQPAARASDAVTAAKTALGSVGPDSAPTPTPPRGGDSDGDSSGSSSAASSAGSAGAGSGKRVNAKLFATPQLCPSVSADRGKSPTRLVLSPGLASAALGLLAAAALGCEGGVDRGRLGQPPRPCVADLVAGATAGPAHGRSTSPQNNRETAGNGLASASAGARCATKVIKKKGRTLALGGAGGVGTGKRVRKAKPHAGRSAETRGRPRKNPHDPKWQRQKKKKESPGILADEAAAAARGETLGRFTEKRGRPRKNPDDPKWQRLAEKSSGVIYTTNRAGETPIGIAEVLGCRVVDLVAQNRTKYLGLKPSSQLQLGTTLTYGREETHRGAAAAATAAVAEEKPKKRGQKCAVAESTRKTRPAQDDTIFDPNLHNLNNGASTGATLLPWTVTLEGATPHPNVTSGPKSWADRGGAVAGPKHAGRNPANVAVKKRQSGSAMLKARSKEHALPPKFGAGWSFAWSMLDSDSTTQSSKT